MFVVAAFIWGFILILFIRYSKSKGFFAKKRKLLIAILLALVLTVADIWLFVRYIPTHFKKNTEKVVPLSTNELLNDSTLSDSTHKPAIDSSKKESLKQIKNLVIDTTEKIQLTNKASIRFYSQGSSEDIEATNHSVACSFNEKTGQIKFSGLIRGFQFENEIMQEHFNDKEYMNSEAFPKTSFKGTIQTILSVNFLKDGKYPVTVEGSLSIHGITKKINVPASILVAGKKPLLKSVFKIKRIDFGITTDEIADELEITVISEFN